MTMALNYLDVSINDWGLFLGWLWFPGSMFAACEGSSSILVAYAGLIN
jgi:hypothetical protein